MAKEKIITAIDVGSTKVSTIIASSGVDKLSVIGVSGGIKSKGITRGYVVDIDDTVESISASLEKAERMAGVSVSSAFLTINGSHIRTENSHGVVAVSHPDEEISTEDVYRVTEAAQAITLPSSEEIIQVIPRDFIVDGHNGVRDPVGMSGIRLEVETNIITGSTTAMRNIAKCVRQVGVDINDMVFTALAASEAVLTDTEKELGTVLIDIGGGTTSIIAYLEGSPILSAVIPVGAQFITHDLAIGLRTRLDEAEKIKFKLSEQRHAQMSLHGADDILNVAEFGLDEESIPKSFLYEIIDARLKEIYGLVALELEKAGLTKKLPAGAVITGGGSLTVGIENMGKRVLKMPIRVGKPKGLTGLIDEIQGPEFSACVGAILYGEKASRINSDLSFDSSKGTIVKKISNLTSKFKKLLP